MAEVGLDISKLSTAIRWKRGDRSLREAVKDIDGISVSTLSRMECGKIPDLISFFTICSWLNISPDVFIKGNHMKREISKRNIITSLILSCKTLDKDKKELVIGMINLAYGKN